jgi:hypothetical protein
MMTKGRYNDNDVVYYEYRTPINWDDSSEWFQKYTGYANFFLNTYPSDASNFHGQNLTAYSWGTPSQCSYVNNTPFSAGAVWSGRSYGYGGGGSGALKYYKDDPKYCQTDGISGAVFLLKTQMYQIEQDETE